MAAMIFCVHVGVKIATITTLALACAAFCADQTICWGGKHYGDDAADQFCIGGVLGGESTGNSSTICVHLRQLGEEQTRWQLRPGQLCYVATHGHLVTDVHLLVDAASVQRYTDATVARSLSTCRLLGNVAHALVMVALHVRWPAPGGERDKARLGAEARLQTLCVPLVNGSSCLATALFVALMCAGWPPDGTRAVPARPDGWPLLLCLLGAEAVCIVLDAAAICYSASVTHAKDVSSSDSSSRSSDKQD